MIPPARKADSAHFKTLLDTVEARINSEVGKLWSGYLYHFTDITNLAHILESYSLRSRSALDELNHQWTDAADPAVIQQTESDIKDYVRLYFRPRTPTAYLTEGIRPFRTRGDGNPHCPVPVNLIFDTLDILTLRRAMFSDGNLARNKRNLFRTAIDFGNLPFEDIYSHGAWEIARGDEIKNRRHAEVVIPNSLELSHLQAIICRSQAEYETLQN